MGDARLSGARRDHDERKSRIEMAERVRKRTRFSLKTKTAVMIILIALAISLAAFFLSSWIVKEIIMTQYSKQAKETTKAVAASLDADDAAAVRDAISKISDST